MEISKSRGLALFQISTYCIVYIQQFMKLEKQMRFAKINMIIKLN